MRQVVLLKWWTAKENYKNFEDFVDKIDIDISKEYNKKRSDNLDEKIAEKFELIVIDRILKDFADYQVRKKIFEKYRNFLEKDCILIWHSLWWSFFLKYINENNLEFGKLILVAPALNDSEVELIWSFKTEQSFLNLQWIQDKIVVFGSRDDFLVDFSDIEILQKKLANSKFYTFNDRWHFLQEDFIELVEEIEK